jgi:hypothetical protein
MILSVFWLGSTSSSSSVMEHAAIQDSDNAHGTRNWNKGGSYSSYSGYGLQI